MATEYGLQLFSVRDITDKDLEGALKAVAEMGYKYVEYAGFFGHSAEQVKEWQDKYGLKCSGTHIAHYGRNVLGIQIQPVGGRLQRVAEYRMTIGDHVVFAHCNGRERKGENESENQR